MKKNWIFLLSLATFMCASPEMPVLAGNGAGTDGGAVLPVSLTAAAPASAQVAAPPATTQIGALAWIEPRSRVITIGAPNNAEGARIETLAAEEGDTVKKGDVIGMFSTYGRNKASYDEALANLELARANLERVRAGNMRTDIQSQRQKVQSLQALEEKAQNELVRVTNLYNEAVVSKARYDSTKAEYDRLNAERRAAELTFKSLATVRPDDVKVSEANLQVAESQVASAKANLDLSSIVAPIDGTILTIHARPGEAVGNAGILDIGDLTVLDAVAEVDENDILHVAKGQKAKVMIPGFAEPFSGTVREIGGQIKKNAVLDSNPSAPLDTRISEVRVEIDPRASERLKRLINMKIKVSILR